ncbi:hypothetical protein PN36_34710 [Candidatus Thiomargarita nelsonii]|uniref:Uncharacterized protein n=1 Tax=Candidatus Thiomargarita nelsonii TaxID=1003181 RepID=A0A0A6S6D5_9GAMM|nr:hypothetical protein PN36_34710 [Candidatus Thiomargarita nelsonii]
MAPTKTDTMPPYYYPTQKTVKPEESSVFITTEKQKLLGASHKPAPPISLETHKTVTKYYIVKTLYMPFYCTQSRQSPSFAPWILATPQAIQTFKG